MTIKKPMKAPAPEPTETSGGAPAATIADRFKLDVTEPKAKPAGSGKGTLVAVIAGLLALAVSGILTFVIYQHWEFLKGA